MLLYEKSPIIYAAPCGRVTIGAQSVKYLLEIPAGGSDDWRPVDPVASHQARFFFFYEQGNAKAPFPTDGKEQGLS